MSTTKTRKKTTTTASNNVKTITVNNCINNDNTATADNNNNNYENTITANNNNNNDSTITANNYHSNDNTIINNSYKTTTTTMTTTMTTTIPPTTTTSATRTCPSVNWMGPSLMPVVVDCWSSDLKNMALVIMVRNSSDMQHDSLCTRVKLERVGREKTESQRWSLAIFLRAEEVKRCLKAMRSSMPATGRIRSTMPSSSSTASQRSHKKIDLQAGFTHGGGGNSVSNTYH